MLKKLVICVFKKKNLSINLSFEVRGVVGKTSYVIGLFSRQESIATLSTE